VKDKKKYNITFIDYDKETGYFEKQRELLAYNIQEALDIICEHICSLGDIIAIEEIDET